MYGVVVVEIDPKTNRQTTAGDNLWPDEGVCRLSGG